MHIAIVLDVEDLLIPALKECISVSIGQEFSGFAMQLEPGLDRISHALEGCPYLPMGGTAVGTGLNVSAGFDTAFVEAVAELTGKQFHVARNKFEAISANDAMVHMSGALNTLACSLFEIVQDIRLRGPDRDVVWESCCCQRTSRGAPLCAEK